MIFLFEFKMDVKVVETTHNINNAFGQGTANSAWRLEKFYKGDESLWKLMMDGEQSLKLIFLQ